MAVARNILIGIGVFSVLAVTFQLLAGHDNDNSASNSQTPDMQTVSAANDPPSRASCEPKWVFHLERLKSDPSLKVVLLGPENTAHVQRFLDMTMQQPPDLSSIPRVKVWFSWQYQVASLGGSLPAQGVIDIVQDNCLIYRRAGDAAELMAIAKGDWSQ